MAQSDDHKLGRNELLARLAAAQAENARLTDALRERDRTGFAEYRSLVDHSPDYIARINARGEILFINRSVEGVTVEEMQGSTVLKFSESSEAPMIRAALERVFLHEELQCFESRSVEASGVVRLCDIRIAPIPNGTALPVAATFVATDITEKRASALREATLKSDLERAEHLKSLGLLASGIAHDFNNLLIGVMGNASLLLSDPPSAPRELNALKGIEVSAQRAAELCRQLLAYSGKGRFMVMPVDLSHLIPHSTRLLGIEIPDRIRLHVECTSPNRAVNVDVVQIRQALMNLVLNAVDALGEATGDIWIRTGTAEPEEIDKCEPSYGRADSCDYAYLEVKDSGCGLDEQAVQRLFEPFFSTKHSGRGLGMASVAGTARGHQGGLTVRSKPGKGTTIRLLLPCTNAPPQPVPQDPSSCVSKLRSFTGTVLIVDDDLSVCEFVRAVVSSLGLRVLTTSRGANALGIVQANSDIELIVLDLTMPGMSGEKTLRRLRETRSSLPVILSSGYTNREEEMSADLGPNTTFLRKPYRAATLIEKVSQMLSPPPTGSLRNSSSAAPHLERSTKRPSVDSQM